MQVHLPYGALGESVGLQRAAGPSVLPGFGPSPCRSPTPRQLQHVMGRPNRAATLDGSVKMAPRSPRYLDSRPASLARTWSLRRQEKARDKPNLACSRRMSRLVRQNIIQRRFSISATTWSTRSGWFPRIYRTGNLTSMP